MLNKGKAQVDKVTVRTDHYWVKRNRKPVVRIENLKVESDKVNILKSCLKSSSEKIKFP